MVKPEQLDGSKKNGPSRSSFVKCKRNALNAEVQKDQLYCFFVHAVVGSWHLMICLRDLFEAARS